MTNLIKVKNEFNSLESLFKYLQSSSNFECYKEYDKWELRTDENGQMAQCIVLKKSNMNAVKIYFVNDDTIKISHVIPNKMMDAYFGQSQKSRQDILEVITGKIKKMLLASSQEKAFKELEAEISKVAA